MIILSELWIWCDGGLERLQWNALVGLVAVMVAAGTPKNGTNTAWAVP